MSKAKCSICNYIVEEYKYFKKENKTKCYDCMHKMGIKYHPKEQPKTRNCAICNESIIWSGIREGLHADWLNADTKTRHRCKLPKTVYIHDNRE